MDLEKFKKDFESSGLTQAAFGKQVSMSSSMVSYYLRKARQIIEQEPVGQFQEVAITNQRGFSASDQNHY